MTKKLTIQDLAAIRDRTRSLTALRDGAGRAKVTVHMGTCGIAAGAREIMETLLEEIRSRNVQDVIVTTSGCAGLCNREPMATVEIMDQTPVKYIQLTPEKMKKVFAEHILEGRIVTEFALAVGSETMY